MSTSNSVPAEASRQSTGVEVVVVGSCNTDLMTYTPRLPSRGETITGSRFETLYGGKGANQAVMARRMGARVAMVGCLGEDSFGSSYLERLGDEGIDCSSMRRTRDVATGVAQICVEDAGGANFIVIVPGANYALSTADVALAVEKLNGARVMMCQAEVRREVTLEALERGRAAGMMTLFNPAPAQADLPDRFLELSDVLCPNETELAILCERNVDPENDDSVCEGARELISRGAKAVVVTLGSRGCMLVSSSSEGYRQFAAERVDAIDTVGAGDAFLGSLGAYLARGAILEDALRNAVRVSTLTVTRAGAQPSYPRSSDLPLELQVTWPNE
ncbi:unnamed protein product [Ascophyllum nodosum]